MIYIFATFTGKKSVFHSLWHPTNKYYSFRWCMAKINPGFNAPNSKMRGSDYILTDVHNGINLKISWQLPSNKPRLLFPQKGLSMPFFRILLMTRHWKRRKFAQKEGENAAGNGKTPDFFATKCRTFHAKHRNFTSKKSDVFDFRTSRNGKIRVKPAYSCHQALRFPPQLFVPLYGPLPSEPLLRAWKP